MGQVMAQRSNEGDIGILRVDDDRADVARIVQPDVLTVLAAIETFVNAVSVRD